MKITLSIYLVLSKRERTCFNYRFEYYPLGAHICWYCSQYYTALNQNFQVEDGMRGFTGLATVVLPACFLLHIISYTAIFKH